VGTAGGGVMQWLTYVYRCVMNDDNKSSCRAALAPCSQLLRRLWSRSEQQLEPSSIQQVYSGRDGAPVESSTRHLGLWSTQHSESLYIAVDIHRWIDLNLSRVRITKHKTWHWSGHFVCFIDIRCRWQCTPDGVAARHTRIAFTCRSTVDILSSFSVNKVRVSLLCLPSARLMHCAVRTLDM